MEENKKLSLEELWALFEKNNLIHGPKLHDHLIRNISDFVPFWNKSIKENNILAQNFCLLVFKHI